MCTLATLAACFSLGGVYVDSGLDYRDLGEQRTYWQEMKPIEHNGVIETGGTWKTTNSPQNPYGRIGLGYQMDIDFGSSKVILTLTGYHESSISTGRDTGVNGITFGARYFPFARQ